ncbi:MAG: efflux RND transporter periplasmic adaptor subunit [Deltaproteobacteria bacterium HGW-Deltaproteobacteria-19]|jgi:RND family efflux transporter MFP subunit|nr:MAG: efflux RND transporter periplasmic adaptor subunit [Deltaproteobacteria bacterium HGW-Deltaproteobacteria-19]
MKTLGGETNVGKRFGHIFAVSCVLLGWILSVAMVAGCKGKTEKEDVRRPEVSGVTVAAVAPSTVDDIYEATGTVRSDRTSMVASRVMGVVTALLVREGDTVKAGQLLLTIDDRDAAQRMRAADMALESAKQSRSLAEVTWQRYKNLYEDKALTRQEMDQVEAQKKVAEAEYERAKAMAEEARIHRSFTQVTAPVSGRVTERRTDVGSMASPGIPLLIVEGGGSPMIEASIDAGLGDKVKAGMAVTAMVQTLDGPLQGTVREVFPAVDTLSRTFTVKVGLKDARPRSGLFARVRIPVGKREAILVPAKAVVWKGQLTGVYAVDGQGVITYRLVRAGNASAAGTEILSGLTAGDRIITDGLERVIDGGVISRGTGE